MTCKTIPFPAPKWNAGREVSLDALAARIEYQQRRHQPTTNAHGVRVGDLYFDSWGYDQTNIDFYQVVALKGKATAIIRAIAGERETTDNGWTGKVRPIRDHFITEKTFQRRTRTGYDGRPHVGSPREGHTLRPTRDDAAHAYSSYC